jgi:hypothetical protein
VLAKLRIHSESTVVFLEETFKKLSQKLLKFQAYTCTYSILWDYLERKQLASERLPNVLLPIIPVRNQAR